MIPGVEGLVAQATDHAFADGRIEAIKRDIQEGKIKKASFIVVLKFENSPESQFLIP